MKNLSLQISIAWPIIFFTFLLLVRGSTRTIFALNNISLVDLVDDIDVFLLVPGPIIVVLVRVQALSLNIEPIK